MPSTFRSISGNCAGSARAAVQRAPLFLFAAQHDDITAKETPAWQPSAGSPPVSSPGPPGRFRRSARRCPEVSPAAAQPAAKPRSSPASSASRPECPNCHAPLGLARADDAPPYFTILIVGHIVIPLLRHHAEIRRPADLGAFRPSSSPSRSSSPSACSARSKAPSWPRCSPSTCSRTHRRADVRYRRRSLQAGPRHPGRGAAHPLPPPSSRPTAIRPSTT